MATTMKLIAKTTLGSTANSVTFSSIPGTYTDLCIVVSARSSAAATNDFMSMRFNGDSGNNYTYRQLQGDGTSATSQSGTLSSALAGGCCGDSATASTFGSSETYIPNYAGSTNKSVSSTGTSESNATSSNMRAQAALWSNTAAITNIEVLPGTGPFRSGSSFFLYGITRA